MIKIEEDGKSFCNCCDARDTNNPKRVLFVRGSSNAIALTLCKTCREDLLDLLLKEGGHI